MTPDTVNAAEAFVFGICQRSILSLWCYNNPLAKNGKELCDILVVCDRHVIIFSVKNIELKGDGQVEWERWRRRAIDDSVKQLYGADRWLREASSVVRSDGTLGVALPPASERRVHRIAVACGGNGEGPIASGDFGKGFVHVMTEQTIHEVLGELDTVLDLAEYLTAKESFISSGCSVVLEGSESNLVGLYLFNGRRFPDGPDRVVVNDGIWQTIREKPEFLRRKVADQESYAWDRLIEGLIDPRAKPVEGSSVAPTDLELALRCMALEKRFARRLLGQGVLEFLTKAANRELRSRIVVGPSEVIYVLVRFRGNEDAEYRRAELGTRCFLARHRVGRGHTIVGIGLGELVPGQGATSDLIYLHLPSWSAEDDEHAGRMQAALGYFDGVTLQRSHSDEFPGAD